MFSTLSQIREKYKEEDWKNYTIMVHALKSTARMIGAMELSEKFYRLEQLGNAEDEKTLALETPDVLSLLLFLFAGP